MILMMVFKIVCLTMKNRFLGFPRNLFFYEVFNMIKGIFFDIDGTLIDSRGNFLTSSYQALQSLKSKGIKVFLSTGRHMLEINQVDFKVVKFDGYITLNGQICLSADYKSLMRVPIQNADAETIVKIFNQKIIPIMLVQENRMYINFVNEEVKKAQKTV